jgi:hypothetical protein
LAKEELIEMRGKLDEVLPDSRFRAIPLSSVRWLRKLLLFSRRKPTGRCARIP